MSLPYLHSTVATAAEVTLYPTTTIMAHTDPCKCIAWSPIDANIMYTGECPLPCGGEGMCVDISSDKF